MIQQILVFIVFGLALGFLGWKFFWKNKKKTQKGCGSSGVDCGCD